jgi:4-hydroxybenzoate polyprenyltransferase
MKLSVAMRLARVSNLPTVWTNVVAGLVLAGAAFTPTHAALLMLAMSFFYTGGMVLNDYFDRAIDARERPERPIPAGETTAASAFVLGSGLLTSGEGVIAAHALGPNGMGAPPIATGALLAFFIVVYDLSHKQNPLSPLLMAGCRVLVYVTAALSVAPYLGMPLLGGCTALLVYLAVLTWIAKQEGRGRIRAPIGMLVAGISLVDAAMVLAQGQPALALACATGFPLTLLFQRRISGT